jgi:hypothetical protein
MLFKDEIERIVQELLDMGHIVSSSVDKEEGWLLPYVH